jgi:hypothetical protein
VEEWSIEAESVEEAREFLNSGHGERAHIGECIHCEVTSIENQVDVAAFGGAPA